MSAPGFELEVAVTAEDIDELRHANNLAYLRWILAAAAGHWAWYVARAPVEAVAGVAWVVLRHEVDYRGAAVLGDRLLVRTWVPTCTATTCDRYAVVIRARDDQVLARTQSSYCVVDQATGRPRRLDDSLRAAIGEPELRKRERVERIFPEPPVSVVRS